MGISLGYYGINHRITHKITGIQALPKRWPYFGLSHCKAVDTKVTVKWFQNGSNLYNRDITDIRYPWYCYHRYYIITTSFTEISKICYDIQYYNMRYHIDFTEIENITLLVLSSKTNSSWTVYLNRNTGWLSIPPSMKRFKLHGSLQQWPAVLDLTGLNPKW